jgi:hypothetical protein
MPIQAARARKLLQATSVNGAAKVQAVARKQS